MIDAYEVFSIYWPIKLHFTTKNYDIAKYHGKAPYPKEKFLQRHDKSFFYRLGKKYERGQLKWLFVANFVENSKCWVGNLDESLLVEYQRRNESIDYNFTQEIRRLFQTASNASLTPRDIFIDNSGQHPLILDSLINKDISWESFIILDDLTNFTKLLDKHITIPLVWEEYRQKIMKYRPFVSYDRKAAIKELSMVLNKHSDHNTHK